MKVKCAECGQKIEVFERKAIEAIKVSGCTPLCRGCKKKLVATFAVEERDYGIFS